MGISLEWASKVQDRNDAFARINLGTKEESHHDSMTKIKTIFDNRTNDSFYILYFDWIK